MYEKNNNVVSRQKFLDLNTPKINNQIQNTICSLQAQINCHYKKKRGVAPALNVWMEAGLFSVVRGLGVRERWSCEQLWSHFDNDGNNKHADWRGGAAKACKAQGFAVAASLLLNR